MGAAKATDTTANHTIICGNWKLWLNRTKILAWHLHCNRHTTHTLHTRHTNFIIITLLLSRTLNTFKFSTYVNYICWKYNLRWAEEMHQITARRYVILLSLCAIFCIYIHIPWMRLRQKCSPFWRRTHNRNTHIPMALRMQNIYIYILQFDIQIELHLRSSNEIVASLSIHRLDATLPQQNAHHHIFFPCLLECVSSEKRQVLKTALRPTQSLCQPVATAYRLAHLKLPLFFFQQFFDGYK